MDYCLTIVLVIRRIRKLKSVKYLPGKVAVWWERTGED